MIKFLNKACSIWHHTLRNIIIVGLLVRIPLAFFTAWTDTTINWEISNMTLAGLRILHYYPPPWLLTMHIFILPLSLFYDPSNFARWEGALVKPWTLGLLSHAVITSPIFNFILKVPLLIFDVLIGLLLYYIVRDKLNISSAKKACMLWYFNPLVILNVAVIGQTDVTLTLFMLASFYLLMKKDNVFSGMSLGLSVFYKIYNIGVLPLFLLFTTFGLSERFVNRYEYLKSEGIENALKFLAGFLIPYVFLAPTVVFFGSLTWEWMTIPRLTGFNVWGVIQFIPQAHAIIYWANSNFFIINTSMLVAGVIAVIIILFTVSLMKGKPVEKLAYGIIALLSATFLTMTMANPHQIISIFPFLILMDVLYKKYGMRYLLLSLAGLGYIISMRGFFAFLFPLGEYTQLLSIKQLVNLTSEYMLMNGKINNYLNRDLMLIFAIIGVITMFSSFFPRIGQGSNRMKSVKK